MNRVHWQGTAPKAATILGALIVLGALLRLAALDRDSLWFDEAVSYLVARLPVSSILDNTIQDPHPPLYYTLLHFWRRWLPQQVIYARLLSALWGILLIPVVYALAMELLHQRRIALCAALLIAVSPFHVLYSHELRMYTWLMFLVTAQALAYLRARKSAGGLWWSLYAIVTLFALYTHLFSLLALLGIALHAFSRRQEQKAFRLTVAIASLSLLMFLPWVFNLATESQIGAGSLRPLVQDRAIEFHVFKPITSLTFLLFGQSEAPWYVATAFFLALSFFVVLIMEANKSRRQAEALDLGLPGLMVMTNIGLPVAVYFIRPFFLPERTMAAASPFLVILLAWGVTRRGSPLPYLAGGAAVIMAVGSLLFLAGASVKPPYREAIRYVEQHRLASDIVAHTSDGSYLPSLGYVNFPNHVLLAGDPDPRKPEAVIRALGGEIWTLDQVELASQRLWMIVALEHSLQWQKEQSEYANDRFQRLEANDFGGISVALYQLGLD